MSDFIKRNWRRLVIFLFVLGPGVITAVADNDAGGVATYSVAASMYGMASQFLIIPETILLGLTQEIGARIAIVTKKGLGDLIREHYGIKMALLIFIFYFITNQAVVLQNVTGLKSSYQIIGLPWQISLVLTCFFLIFFVIKFDYKKLQRIFLFLIFFYISFLISALITKPNWSEAFKEAFIFPSGDKVLNLTFWFSRIAVLGTTITAWGQFFVHSYIIDKKLTEQHLKYERLEVYIGAFITNFFSFMMALAVTNTIYRHNITITDGFSAALAIKPFAGELTYSLFALGLFGASILGLTIVPLATAYVFSEIFGYEGSLDASFIRGRLFYSFFIIQIVLGLLAALIPQINLFKLTLYADFLNGAMLPLIFYFLIKFSENKNLMGNYVSKGFTSIFVRASGILISLGVLITFIGKILRII